ncbi:hypothetical protein L9F63_014423, partial [Diploptera punctata]
TAVSELISIISSLSPIGVMSFLGGFLLLSIDGQMNLWIVKICESFKIHKFIFLVFLDVDIFPDRWGYTHQSVCYNLLNTASFVFSVYFIFNILIIILISYQ